VIPFETRVAIFRQFISNDRKRLGIERHIYNRSKRHRAVVRRAHVSEDSYAHLNGLGAALKGTIEIVFIDEHGMEESGIDGGGLFKELLTSSVSSLSLSTYVLTRRCRLSKEAFDTDRGLWLATKEQELYPNPHSYARESTQLSWYTFIGRILGKALYEGILIDVRFAGFFLAKWLGRQSYRGLLPSIDKREGTEDWAVVDDLASLDPELYNGLMFLKNYTGDVEADLSLNFSITDDGMYPLPSPPSAAVTDGVCADFGVSRTIDLIAGGSDIPVTNENRIQYIYLTSHYRLNSQIEKQCAAFFSGLSEIIPERFLRMFNQAELRMLVGTSLPPSSLPTSRTDECAQVEWIKRSISRTSKPTPSTEAGQWTKRTRRSERSGP
jgi:ubiquitin-protein ligase E3 C